MGILYMKKNKSSTYDKEICKCISFIVLKHKNIKEMILFSLKRNFNQSSGRHVKKWTILTKNLNN